MATRSWDPITPEYVSERATEWERRDLPIVRKINRREQMYHLDWQVQKDVNREYLVSEAPQIMANRAIDKLCSQPPLLTILADAEEAEIIDEDTAKLSKEMTEISPLERETEMSGEDAAWPRASAEEKEALLAGLWLKVEEDQGVNLTRVIARQAVVTGYAVGRVINLMPDEVHEGEISTRVQILDRRFYHEAPGPGGGYPEEVLYTRRERAIVLKSEGWEVPINADDNEYIRLSDYWRRIRVPVGAKVVDGEWTGEMMDGDNDDDDVEQEWETQVWHAIVLDGGMDEEEDRDAKSARASRGVHSIDGEFAKQPTNMTEATKGLLTRIPYAMRRARPSATNPTSATAWSVGGSNNILSPYGVSYEGYEAHSFIEVYDSIWESMNRIRSYRAHGVRMAVDPPSVAKTDNGRAVSIELRVPGAQNTLKKGEEVQPWILPNLSKEISALDQDLRTEAQQATFSTANLGQGSLSSSGVMTEKLQEAGAQSVKAFQELCETFEQDLVGLLSMMARAYLLKRKNLLTLPSGRRAIRGDFSKLDGQEIIRVHLPSMSFLEMMQAITAAKTIAEPGHDGWSIVSRDTARELAGLPYPILEGQKVKRQRVEESDFMLEAARAKFFQQTADQQKMAEEQAQQQAQQQQQAAAATAAATGQPSGVAGGPPLLQMGSNSAVRAHLNLSYKDLPPQDQAAMLRAVGLPASAMAAMRTSGTPMGGPPQTPGAPMGQTPTLPGGQPHPWMPAQAAPLPSTSPMGVQGGAGPINTISTPALQPPPPPGGLAKFAGQVVRRVAPMFRRGV